MTESIDSHAGNEFAQLGAGIMGSSIASALALAGANVTVLARDAQRARLRTHELLSKARRWGLSDETGIDVARERLRFVASPDEVPDTVGAVLESLPESLPLKVDVLGRVLQRLGDGVVVATNTSSLSVREIGEGIGREESTVGLHFMNPALLMPVVEVVSTTEAAPAAVQRCLRIAARLGKRVIFVADDAPGFVWNRLQIALLREAVQLVSDGVASPGDVDAAVELGLARRWQYAGPLMTARLGGAETFRIVATNLLPLCSQRHELDDLERHLPSPENAAAVGAAREEGLAELLISQEARFADVAEERGIRG
jgi:3-hydroxybutyryl-CoA dehydrogenase